MSTSFQWVPRGNRAVTQIQFDGAGNCIGATGLEANRHTGCLVGGGSTDPNKIVVGFSGPINPRSFSLATDVSITGDVGTFSVQRAVASKKSISLFTNGTLPTTPDAHLTIQLHGIDSKKRTLGSMDPWSITVNITAGSASSSPRILDVTPSTGSNLTQGPTLVDVHFSEDLQQATVTDPANFRLTKSTDDVFGNSDDVVITPSRIDYSTATDRAQFVINGQLSSGLYQVWLSGSGMLDLAGNPLDGNGDGSGGDSFTSTFRVNGQIDGTSPTVTVITPAGGGTLNPAPGFIEIEFSEDLVAAGITDPANFQLVGSGGDDTFGNGNDVAITPAAINYNPDTDRARFVISGQLPNDQYQVRLSAAAVMDLAGNQLDGDGNGTAGGDFTSRFRVLVPDTIPPRVLTVTPSTGSLLNQSPGFVEVQFNETMLASSVTNSANFLVMASGGDGVFDNGNDVAITPSSITYDSVTRRARFVIGSPLANDVFQVRLRASGGMQDAAGNFLDGNGNQTGGDDYTSFFRVNDVVPPTVTSITPGAEQQMGAAPTQITVQFSEAMDPATIQGTSVALFARGSDADFSKKLLASVAYNSANQSATIVPGESMGDDIYLVRVDGAVVADLDGNKLDGDGNGTGGDSYSSTFVIASTTNKVGGDPPDPFGDTTAADGFGRVPPTAAVHDIESVGVVSDQFNAYFRATFFGDIQPASRSLRNSLFGFYDIDSDQNLATGAPSGSAAGDTSKQDTFGEQVAGSSTHLLGDEFYIDLGSEASHPGQVNVFGTSTGTWQLDLDGGRTISVGESSFVFQPIGSKVFLGDWSGTGHKSLGSLAVSTEPLRSHRIYLDINGNRRYDPNEDLDGDGVLDVAEVDTNGNGIPDPGEDVDGDGRFDANEDRNGNGLLDNEGPFTLGNPSDFPNPIVLVGDTNGDGKDNIVLFDPTTAKFLIDADGNFRDSPADVITTTFAQVGDMPFLADFDGDGKAEIAVYRAGIGFIVDGNNDYQSGPGDVTMSDFTSEDLNGNGVLNNGVIAPLLNEVADGKDYNGDGVLTVGVNEDLNSNGVFNNGVTAPLLDELVDQKDYNNDGDLTGFTPVGGVYYAPLSEAGDNIDYNNDGDKLDTVSEDLNGDGLFNNGVIRPLLNEVADNKDYNRNGFLEVGVSEDLNGNGLFNNIAADIPVLGDWDGFFEIDFNGNGSEDLNRNGVFNDSVNGPLLNEVIDNVDYNNDGDKLDTAVSEDRNNDGKFNNGIDAPLLADPSEDINGNGIIDGKTVDIGWFRPATSELFLNRNPGIRGGFTRLQTSQTREASEDTNRDGILAASEDKNNNGLLDLNDGPLPFPKFDALIADASSNDIVIGQQDFNGDGKDEVGFYRPSTGQFFIDQSGDGQFQGGTEGPFQFGQAPSGTTPADVPVVGDLDGDGDSDIGVFHKQGDVSVGLAPIFYRNRSFTVKVPLGLIGETPVQVGPDADFLNFGLVVGTAPVFLSMTDEAPNICPGGACTPADPPLGAFDPPGTPVPRPRPFASGPLSPVKIAAISTNLGPLSFSSAPTPPTFSTNPPGYPTSLIVDFTGPIDPTTVDVTTVQLFRTGGDGVFGNSNDIQVLPTSLSVSNGPGSAGANDRITFVMPVVPELPGDDYHLILRGDDPIRDANGVPIDGEFITFILPSGDGSAQGDFVAPFRIDRPPIITSVRLTKPSDRGVPEVSDTGVLDDGSTNDRTPTFIGVVVDDRLRSSDDPIGDTFGTGTNQPDLTGISAEFSTATQATLTTDPLDVPSLAVALQFSNPVSLPSQTSSDPAVFGFVDLDTDQNSNTGGVGWFEDLNGDRSFVATSAINPPTPAEGPLRFGAMSGDPKLAVVPVPGNWFVAATKDHTDFGIYDPVTGLWSRDLNGDGILQAAEINAFTAVPGRTPLVGNFFEAPGTADNGKDERGEYDSDRNSSTFGSFFLDTNGNDQFDGLSETFSFVTPPSNPPKGLEDVAVVGDWNGNGIDDIGVYRPSGIFPENKPPLFPGAGLFFIDSNGNHVFDVSEDRNGDGAFTPGAPPIGEDTNLNGRLDLNDGPFAFGSIGDRPIVGDWNGSGTDKVGIYRTNTSSFTLDINGNKVAGAGEGPITYGTVGDVGIVGDWDGDGADQIGVFRPTSRQFALDLDGNRALTANELGIFAGSAGTVPIVGNFDGDVLGTQEVGTFLPQNASTQHSLGRGTAPQLGSEYVIDLGSEIFHPGLADVIDAKTGEKIDFDSTAPGIQGTPVTLFPDTRGIVVKIPLDSIGETGDGNVNLGVVIGTQTQFTDEAPESIQATSSQAVLVSLESDQLPTPASFDNGTVVTEGFGRFVLTLSNGTLNDGTYDGVGTNPKQLTFKATDSALNTSTRQRSVRVDGQPAKITAYGAFEPLEDLNRNGMVDPGEGGVINSEIVATFDKPPSFFQVTFNEPLDPNGPVNNLSNYTLFTADGIDRSSFLANVTYNPGPGAIPDAFDEDLNNDGVLDIGEDRNANGILDRFPDIPADTVRIRTGPGMPTGVYVFTVKDTITDVTGNLLDGENFGEPILPPPTGNGVAGGDFQVTFTLDQPPPRVTQVFAVVSSGPDGVVGTADDLGPDGLVGTNDDFGPDATPGTPDDASVPFIRDYFDPTGVSADRPFIGVRVSFSQPMDRTSISPDKVLLVRSGGDGDFQNGGIRVASVAGWPQAIDFSNDDATLLFRINPAELPLPADYYRFTMIGGGNLPAPNPVGTNIDVSVSNPAATPPGGTPLPQYQGEPSIDLNPINPNNLVAASNNKSGNVVTAYLSTDGGLTWDDRPLTNVVKGVSYAQSSHPSVAFDRGNRAYVGYVARNPGVNSAIVLAGSSDGGNTYTQFTEVATSTAPTPVQSGSVDDFPWIVADDLVSKQNGTANPFVNRVYASWTRSNFFNLGNLDEQEILFMRSVDNGNSFLGETTDCCPLNGNLEPQVRVNDEPGVNNASRGVGNVHLAIGPNTSRQIVPPGAAGGIVYAVWEDWGGPTVQTSSPVQIRIDRSFDGGETFVGSDFLGSDIFVGTSQVNGFTDQGLNRYVIPAQPDLGIAANPVIDVDRTGGSFNGRIYLAYVDRSATSIRTDTDIFMKFSDDQGLTWSPATQVNDPAADGQLGDASQFHPSLRVDPITGRVAVTWYDTRNALDNRAAELFTAIVTAGQNSVNVGLNFRVSAVPSDESTFGQTPNDPDDYGNNADVVIHNGVAHAVWTDTRLKDGDSDPAEEVFTARIDTNLLFGPTALVTGIRDRVGNQLDGEAIGVSSDGVGLPSGDGIEGGTFVAGTVVTARIITVDSSFQEDPFIPSAGTPANPFPTIQRGLAASKGFAAGGPTVVQVLNGRGTPYIIEPGPGLLDGSMHIPNFTVLNVEAGSIVKLRSSNIDADGAGAVLQVRGTQLSPVRLTSTINDGGLVGGDTNGDGNNTSPRGGDWGGLVFRPRIDNVLTIVDQAVIDFGGGPVPNAISPRFDSLYLESTATRPVSPALTNLLMTNNGIPGSADNMQFAISANLDSFVDSTVAAVDGTADGTVGPLIRNITMRDNSVNGLWIRPSSDSGEATLRAGSVAKWDDPVVHVLDSLVHLVGSGQRQPTTLTINPGMVVKGINAAIAIEGTARLNVGSAATGDSRVVLTSFFDDEAGFLDSGFDTNNDGIAGVDPTAIIPRAGDWAGLDFRSSINNQAFGLIDEADFRYGGGAYPLGVTVPSIGLGGPGYFQVTRNTIQFDASAAPIQVVSNVLRPDVPFDVQGTPLVNEAVLVEDPLFRGNRLTNNNINGMLILPIVVPEVNAGPARLVNTSFFDLNDNGVNELSEGIDILWDDTDITHVLTGTLSLPGKVQVPPPISIRSKFTFESFVRTADISGGVRRIDFETNPQTGQAFRPNATDRFRGLASGPGYPSVKQWQNTLGVTFSSIASGTGNRACPQASLTDPDCLPANLGVDGEAVPAGTTFGDPLIGNPDFTPTSGFNNATLPKTGPNLGSRTTASALTTDPRSPESLRNDGSIQIDFSGPVFAAGFYVVGSNATSASETIDFVIRDNAGTLLTVPAPPALPVTFQAVPTSTFFGSPDVASDNFFVGLISPFPIVRILVHEDTGLESIGGTPPVLIRDRIGIDDLVFSTVPISPIVPRPIQPSAAQTLISAAPGDQLRSFDGTVFETLNQGESLVVKSLGADPSGNSPLFAQINRANWGAGLGGGLDDGNDDCTSQSSCLTDWGVGSALRIIGRAGNEATGQPPVPVIMTSLRDDTIGPLGVPQDTNNDANSTSPAPGDWGAIEIGGRLTNDRDDLFTAGPDGIVGLEPGLDGVCGTSDDIDGRLDNVTNPQLVAQPGVFGTFVGRPNGCQVGLPEELDKSFGSYITNSIFKFGSKIRLQSASQVPPFGQEEFFRSTVISNNQIYNFSEYGVLAHFGIHRNPASAPPAPCSPGDASPPCIEAFAIEPFVYNNIIANVAALNGGLVSQPFVGVRIDEDPFIPPPDFRCAPSHSVVLHNTLFALTTAIDFSQFAPCPFTRGGGTQMALDNLISDTTGIPIPRVTSLVGFNLFFNDPSQGANAINGNARWSDGSLFVDVNKLDFRLKPFSSTGQPNPAIDAALSEFTPAPAVSDCTLPLNFSDCWGPDALDDIIVRLPGPTSPIGPEKDLFGSLRLDDIRVSNLGNGAKPFFDIGAVESRDFGAPTVTDLELVNGTTLVQVQPSTLPAVGAVVPNPPQRLVATFSEDLDVRTLTGRSFRITASGGDGTFFDGNELPIGAATIVFDAVLNTATFTPAASLLEDTYRVELAGTGASALTDVQGVRLDGEFRGYPSGDGFPGGDFVAFFAVQIAPRVTSVVARSTGSATALDSQFPPGSSFVLPTPPTRVDATFSELVNIPVGSFRLTGVGPDLVFGSADDIQVAGTVTFDPFTLVATFTPTNPAAMPNDTFYQVVLDGTGANAITDASNIPLDGENNEPVNSTSGDGNAGGDWIGYLRTGNIVSSVDRTIFVDVTNTGLLENGSPQFPFNTIQEGLDAVDDTRNIVVVLPGTYFENVRLNNLIHNGVTLKSRDGDSVTRIVVAQNEDLNCNGIQDLGENDLNGNGEFEQACNPGGPDNNNQPVPVDALRPAIDIDKALNVSVEGFQITTSGLPLFTPAGAPQPSGGVGVRVNASNAALRRNTIFDNRTGVFIDLGVPGSNPRLENNVIWANNGPGVEVRGQVDVPAEIVNNTIVFNVDGVRLVDTGTGIPRIANIFNNLIVGSTGAGIRSVNTAGATIDFNDVFQNLGGNYINVQQIGTHNISADPLFLGAVQRPATGRPNPATANWRLGSFSPAIDVGLGNEDVNSNGILDPGEDQNGNGKVDVPPLQDHDGRDRFDDPNVFDPFTGINAGRGLPNFVDLGAFERQSDSSGPPGSIGNGGSGGGSGGTGGRISSSTAVRALDTVLSSGDYRLTTAEPDHATTGSGSRQSWLDSLDRLLENGDLRRLHVASHLRHRMHRMH